MQIAAGTRRIHSLLNGLRTGALVPDPNFQRRLVWSNKHKSAFIETVLRGYPFPEIYIAAGDVNPDTGEATEMLVDGQQRLTTLKQYVDASKDLKLSDEVYCPPKFGPLPKPRLWYNIHDLKGGPDGETKTKNLHP